MFYLWLTTKFSQCTVKVQTILTYHYWATVEWKCFIWFLKLSTKNSLLWINCNENASSKVELALAVASHLKENSFSVNQQSKWMNQQMNEQMNKCTNKWTNIQTNKLLKICINKGEWFASIGVWCWCLA